MSIKEIPCYTVCCDRCGKSVDKDTEFVGWSDKEAAVDVAGSSDWWVQEEYHYCPDCYCYDEEDKLVIRPAEEE